MPRIAKRGLNPRAGLDEPYVRAILTTGHFWLHLAPPGIDGPPDESTLADAWELLGDTITAEHIKAAPGTRPAGWWRFGPGKDEPRRMLRAGRLGPSGPPDWFGMPSRFGPAGAPNATQDLPTYEDEYTYLERRGLLTEGE